MSTLNFIIAFMIWPAIAYGFLLYYGWSSSRAQKIEQDDSHRVPGE